MARPLERRNVVIIFLVHMLVSSRTLGNVSVMKVSKMLRTMVSSCESLVSFARAIAYGTTKCWFLVVNAVNVPRQVSLANECCSTISVIIAKAIAYESSIFAKVIMSGRLQQKLCAYAAGSIWQTK